MKSEVKKADNKREKFFPKLMECINPSNLGLIVFFEKNSFGQVLSRGIGTNTYHEGYTSRTWSMDDFIDFEGSVTLSND